MALIRLHKILQFLHFVLPWMQDMDMKCHISFLELCTVFSQKIRRQIENKGEEFWRCQYSLSYMKFGHRLALFFMFHLASLWDQLHSCVSGPLLRYDFKGGGKKFFTLYTNCSWMHLGSYMSGEKCFFTHTIFKVHAYFRANLISIFFSPKCPLCNLKSVLYSNINFIFIHLHICICLLTSQSGSTKNVQTFL